MGRKGGMADDKHATTTLWSGRFDTPPDGGSSKTT
jgi:hypothetical protein